MAFLLKGKKEDLIALAKQFGVSVESDLTKPKIKDLILKSEDYDEEDAKVMLDSIIEDRHLAEVEKQNEREERLRKEEREHELEKLRIQAQRNMKRKAPPELQNHFLDEWSSINSPADVARKFEQYDDVRRTLKPKASDLFFRRKDEVQGANKFQNYPRRPANFRDGNNKFEKRPLQLNRNSCVEKNKPWRPVNCCYCQTLGHFGVDCPRRPKNTKSNKPLAPIVQVCSELSREKMRTRKVALRSKTFYALIDTGSSVTLLREDICKQIIKPSELSRETIILSGLGKSQVKTKGSFRQDIELDGQKYSLTWHVVPTSYLDFQAIIGSDILEQASLDFAKEGVKFRRREDVEIFSMHAQLYEARPKDEIEIEHISSPEFGRVELNVNFECQHVNNDEVIVLSGLAEL
ncbi:hypothetical protein HNY73_021258 [Argiope bruennichi]|uniref:Retropepsins domain-containing protein n=1 Tax=Argiope bruennichi TaxID=94029 RepID=A0A8T0EAN0_ARGBR|nr:hypothetical protein HNY73_021258 [Argiope bruennichi]